MNHVALIGDLVHSRSASGRAALQRTLAAALARVNRSRAGLASPFTLTLGDEFQALYGNPHRIFRDVVALTIALHPVRARFALAVGPLSTRLNRRQAIGMDGPVFHAARQGIETLRSEDRGLGVFGGPPDAWRLAQPGLRLIDHQMRRWNLNRLRILLGALQGHPPARLARQLAISPRAVYKNLSAAAIPDCVTFLDAVAEDLAAALQ